MNLRYCALLACSLPLVAHAEIAPPYQLEAGKVVFKPYGNQPGAPLAGAQAEDFEVIYRNDDFSIALSQGRYFCNEHPLPDSFGINTAKALGSFLLSGQQAYAYCEQVKTPVNTASFKLLDHPFASDDRHVFLITGEVLDGADPKQLKTAHGQAADQRHYYYVAEQTRVIPHKGKVTLYDVCQGWAKIDGALYFEGEAQKEVDAASFHCLNFSSAVTKDGFYSGNQRIAPLPTGVDSALIKPLQENFVTDGTRVWYVNIKPTELAGVNLAAAKVEYDRLSDGVHNWDCSVHDDQGNPSCKKTAVE
ncbi:MAG: DKNYY domain-containing protein [Aeromonas sp.]|uniref:DKNYY domain-containing protein n=1 Tax=Aeromonas sp. TaxID=647 RepID=UPI002FCB8F5A